MENPLKHNFDKCPACGMDVIKTDDICWSCQKNLATIYKEMQPKYKRKRKQTSFEPIYISPAKIKKFLVLVLLAFLIINIAHFVLIFSDKASSGINVKAKAYMSAASVVTMLYVIPISQFFGMNATISKMVESFRNSLFDKGAENIPKDDGETYIWWFVIKYQQFEKVVKPSISDYALRNNFPHTEDDIQEFIDWTDQIYNTVGLLAKLKIKDKKFREKRLNVVNALALAYTIDRNLIISTYLDNKTGENMSFYKDNNEINKYKKLFHTYNNLFEYCKTNETESYDYFFKKTERHMYHYILNQSLSQAYLYSLMQKDLKLIDCNNKQIILYSVTWSNCFILRNQKSFCDNVYINTYGDSWDSLLNVYSGNATTHVDAANLSGALSYGNKTRQIATMCPNNKHLGALRNLINKYHQLVEKNR